MRLSVPEANAKLTWWLRMRRCSGRCTMRGLGDESSTEGPAETDWLIVPNWEKFQHYRDRKPTWIKVYAQLLHDPDYLGLSLATKGLLQVIWLAYSQCEQRLTVARLRRLCHDRFGYP